MGSSQLLACWVWSERKGFNFCFVVFCFTSTKSSGLFSGNYKACHSVCCPSDMLLGLNSLLCLRTISIFVFLLHCKHCSLYFFPVLFTKFFLSSFFRFFFTLNNLFFNYSWHTMLYWFQVHTQLLDVI